MTSEINSSKVALTFKKKGEIQMSKSTELALAVQQVESDDQLQSEMHQDYLEMEQLKKLSYQQEVLDQIFGRNR